MDELLRILEDVATLNHWTTIVRLEGVDAANAWLVSINPAAGLGNTLALLEAWYGGSRAIGGAMTGDINFVPPSGQIPIDPRITSGYLYEATVEFLPRGGGSPEFRTLYIPSELLLSRGELEASARTILEEEYGGAGSATIGVDIPGSDIGELDIIGLWRGA